MPGPRTRLALLLLTLPVLFACGGGGSGGEDPDYPPPGITGRVYSPFDLGTLAEQEPNDDRAQSHRLPPIAAQATLEVVGTASDDEDPVDAFRFEVIQNQTVALTLAWTDRDDSPWMVAAVTDPQTGLVVAETQPGDSPRETSFFATRGVVYEVVLDVADGRAAWTLAFEGGAPAESLRATLATRSGSAPSEAPEAPAACARTHVLVQTADETTVQSLATRHGGHVGRRLAGGGVRFELPATMTDRRVERIRAFCRVLAEEDGVLWAEPDWKVRPLGLPANREVGRQWNLRSIGCPEAWDVTMGSSDVVVGIVDSGIVDHPDLAGRIASGGYDFISDAFIAGDGDGRDRDPTDEGAEELSSGRSMWHGTHVAGIVAAAAGSDRGIVGVAPGCRVMVLRALGRTGGLVSDVSDAILYAAGLLETQEGFFLREPLPVLNLSFGIDVDSFTLERACERAAAEGVLLVGASGNDGSAVLFPARYESVVAVGAVDALLRTLDYSNYGEEVDISAPGGDVTKDHSLDGWPDGVASCVLDDTVYPRRTSHTYLEGTSQSSPHVAGVAALLLSVDPTLDTEALKEHLFQSALDRGLPGKDDAYGWGIVQAHLAVRRVQEGLGQTPSSTPRLWLPVQSIRFVGFEDRQEVPLGNAGGGTLELAQPLVETDNDDPWLQAMVEEPVGPAGVLNADRLVITVDRTRLALRGRYAGTVRMRDATGAILAEVRVVVYVEDRPIAGQNLTVATVEPTHGFVRVVDTAAATAGYRYWMPAVTTGTWKIRAGQDLDGDGRSCESGDACGWHGGTSEEDAAQVDVPSPGTLEDLDVVLQLPD